MRVVLPDDPTYQGTQAAAPSPAPAAPARIGGRHSRTAEEGRGRARGGHEIADRHPRSEIGIDEAGLYQSVPADDESSRDRPRPKIVTLEPGQILHPLH